MCDGKSQYLKNFATFSIKISSIIPIIESARRTDEKNNENSTKNKEHDYAQTFEYRIDRSCRINGL